MTLVVEGTQDETPSLPLFPGELSNFDFSIDEGVEDALLARTHRAVYSGWNFNGQVWHDGEQFVCQPWRYHSPCSLHKADTLKELMRSVSGRYGYD